MTIANPAQLERMIREATTINATQKAMLHAARWWMDWQTLEFYPAIKTWAKAASLSHQTIITHVRKLQHLGVIEVEIRTEVGRSRTNVYRLRPSALQVVIPSLFDEPVGCAEEKVKTASGKGQILSDKRSNPQREKVKGFDPISNNQGKLPPQPPRAREAAPDSQPANTGRGRGGELQSRKREDTPAATTARRFESEEPSPTREATREPRRASEAINAPGANPVVEALVAMSVPRAEAAELAKLPHATLALVAFVAESLATAKTPPNRPARFVAWMVRQGPEHLEGWDAFQRRTQQRLIRAARDWALLHTQDAVYGAFVNAVFAAIRPHFPRWDDAIRDGNLHPSVIRPDARPVEVLASLAASCDVDLEIPTDTLRMPEARGEVTTQRSQVQ